MAKDLSPLFNKLKGLLSPYAKDFVVTDTTGEYALDDHSVPGHIISFAAVLAKRGKVSFYLLPTVWSPELLDGVSKELMSRRTKAGGFFNFDLIEPKLLSELRRLVTKAHQGWDPVKISER